eukprot:11314793-Ditylum_brightwellii.AAC.1
MAAVAEVTGKDLREKTTPSSKQTKEETVNTMATSKDDMPKQDPVNNIYNNQIATTAAANLQRSLWMGKKLTASAKVEISGKTATETNSDKDSKRSEGTQRTKSHRSHKKSKEGPKKYTETICPSEIATDDQNSHVSALSSKCLMPLSCTSKQSSNKKKGKATSLKDNKSEEQSSKIKPPCCNCTHHSTCGTTAKCACCRAEQICSSCVCLKQCNNKGEDSTINTASSKSHKSSGKMSTTSEAQKYKKNKPRGDNTKG